MAPSPTAITRRRRWLRRSAAGLCALALALPAAAQTAYPSQPLRLVVPYAPGGSTDQVARFMAERLRAELGQPVVVENKPGANTAVASAQVAAAAPDGQTLLMASGASLVLNPLLYRKLSYDARDLTPVGLMASLPLVVLVSPQQVNARTLAELVQTAKAQPGKLNYASVGIGNPLHLAVELFSDLAGIQMTHVPYNGSAPALSAMLAGDVQVMFDVTSTALPQVKAGKLRALAVTSSQRFPLLPDLPTVAESGYPGYEAGVWFGIAVPAQTPADRQAVLNRAINKVLSDEAFRRQVEGTGVLVHAPRSLAEVQTFVREDYARWREVIQSKRIALD